MELYYSKVDKNKLLHIVRRYSSIVLQETQRVELIPSNNFIQCSALKMKSGVTFRPHRHIFKERTYEQQIAQESWVILKGKVKCIFYDIDDTILATPILTQGDISFTLEGGHTYEIIEDAYVYEMKTGPYEGQVFDKTFIG